MVLEMEEMSAHLSLLSLTLGFGVTLPFGHLSTAPLPTTDLALLLTP